MASVSASGVAAVFLVNLSYPEWTGGWSTGPRFLVPLLPFAMLPVAALLAVGGRWATLAAVLLALAGGVLMLLFQGVGARIPNPIEDPLLDAVLPLWRGDPLPGWATGGRFTRNVVGLLFPEALDRLPPGRLWVQFLPLVAVQALAIAAMVLSLRRDVAPGTVRAGRSPRPEAPITRPTAGRSRALRAGPRRSARRGRGRARPGIRGGGQVLRKLGGAPDAALDGGRVRAVGPGPARARAGVDADDPRTGRRGQVERAGVVGEEEVRLGRERGQLRQARPPGEVEQRDVGRAAQSASTSGRSSGDPTATRPAPCISTARRATSAKCSGGQRFVSQRAPRFRTSAGRGTSARTPRAQRRSASPTATTNRGSAIEAPSASATRRRRSTAWVSGPGEGMRWV